MSLFEFVLVMTSLVLAIGITHLLQHVADIVRHRKILRIDWVPLVWMGSLFISPASYWWALWDFRDLQWTFPSFFFLLATPTLLYIAISLLVSANVTAPNASLAASFEKVRVPFMWVMVVFQTLITWDGWLLGVEPAWNSLRLIGLILVSLYIAGAVSPKRLVQRCVAVSVFAMFIIGTFVLRFSPGAFGPS